MLEQFLNHIRRHQLFDKQDKILLAVSGGLDSMVMLDLFRQAKFNVGVAHCNFQLRGEESLGDEALVNSVCVDYKIPFHLKRFSTQEYAISQGLSIQMAARELRYDFFNTLALEHDYQYIATAHHLNDNIETLLLNVVRGTGLDGLTGIAVKHGKIIRPLLFANRESIADYAAFHRLSWREDSSNNTDDYARNLLRHHVVPVLQNINPNLTTGFTETLERLQGSNLIFKSSLAEFRNKFIREDRETQIIDTLALQQLSAPAVALWELIKAYGFSFRICKDILQPHQSGKHFFSDTHQLTVNRNELIVAVKSSSESFERKIESGEKKLVSGQSVLTLNKTTANSFKIRKEKAVAQLDADLVQYPLTWRSWKPGDAFNPLGMKDQKKISDFLIDEKVSLPDKRNVTVLTSNNEIIWVVGLRIADRYKITPGTREVLVIEVGDITSLESSR